MSVPKQPTVHSHIAEALINSGLSQAVKLGKRKASEAFVLSSIPQRWCLDGEAEDRSSEYREGENDDENEPFQDEDTDEDSGDDAQSPGSITPRERRYRCTFEGCIKTYSKPSRLAEHFRSHTGERPYACSSCGKSYLRESHLHAHMRSHLPASQRPHECTETACEKRFWTLQHLSVHVARVHRGKKDFICSEVGCVEAFSKHNQLRKHVAEKHSPPGTKPYRCEAEGCAKSFATSQKLRKHSKVHQENRYACINSGCISSTDGARSSLYFPTWSALQKHLRESHPPACSYPECNSRTFSSKAALKMHLKLHEDRNLETALLEAAGDSGRPVKRRRGGEFGRDWACEVADCQKAFKSSQALTIHKNVTHLGRRDHVCGYAECGATFGYKHLLQRHIAKKHQTLVEAETGDTRLEEDVGSSTNIEWVTGKDYTVQAMHGAARGGRAPVPCPWPDRFDDPDATVEARGDEDVRCAFLFGRAYDLRRHLKSEHGLVLDKEEVDGWMSSWREQHSKSN